MPTTTRPNPETILAHVQLIRAVDQLLEQAAVVQERRKALEQLLTPGPSDKHPHQPVAQKGGRSRE